MDIGTRLRGRTSNFCGRLFKRDSLVVWPEARLLRPLQGLRARVLGARMGRRSRLRGAFSLNGSEGNELFCGVPFFLLLIRRFSFVWRHGDVSA